MLKLVLIVKTIMIEEFVAFISTHLAITTWLMPWKKIVTGTGDNKQISLMTIWDLLHIKEWPYMDGMVMKYDETLHTVVILLLTFCVITFALAGFGWILRTFFKTIDPNVNSIVDFLTWGCVLSTLIVMVVFQSDFDASFKKQLSDFPNTDTDIMFLPIAVLGVHIALLSYFVGKDIMDRLK